MINLFYGIFLFGDPARSVVLIIEILNADSQGTQKEVSEMLTIIIGVDSAKGDFFGDPARSKSFDGSL